MFCHFLYHFASSVKLIGITIVVNLTTQGGCLHQLLVTDVVILVVWNVKLEEAGVRLREASLAQIRAKDNLMPLLQVCNGCRQP